MIGLLLALGEGETENHCSPRCWRRMRSTVVGGSPTALAIWRTLAPSSLIWPIHRLREAMASRTFLAQSLAYLSAVVTTGAYSAVLIDPKCTKSEQKTLATAVPKWYSGAMPTTQHPKPKCRLFGREHQWSGFVFIPGRFCCDVCGVEDDETWWSEDGRTYIGPSEAVYNDLNPGWLLRAPESETRKAV